MQTFSRWDDVPNGLATKTQLGRDGLKPAPDQAPAAKFHGRYEDYNLYNRAQAVPKRKMTLAQVAAAKENIRKAQAAHECKDCGIWVGVRNLDKHGRCADCAQLAWIDRRSKAALAELQALAATDDWIVIDTETTGLDETAELIEVSIVNAAGETLMNQRIKPQGEVGATEIHGITADDLANSPTFDQVADHVTAVLDSRHVLAFNVDFDRRVLQQAYRQYGLKLPAACRWTCVQDLFSIYFGDWSGYWRDFRKQSLQTAVRSQGLHYENGHSAAGDALMTQKLVKHFGMYQTVSRADGL